MINPIQFKDLHFSVFWTGSWNDILNEYNKNAWFVAHLGAWPYWNPVTILRMHLWPFDGVSCPDKTFPSVNTFHVNGYRNLTWMNNSETVRNNCWALYYKDVEESLRSEQRFKGLDLVESPPPKLDIFILIYIFWLMSFGLYPLTCTCKSWTINVWCAHIFITSNIKVSLSALTNKIRTPKFDLFTFEIYKIMFPDALKL